MSPVTHRTPVPGAHPGNGGAGAPNRQQPPNHPQGGALSLQTSGTHPHKPTISANNSCRSGLPSLKCHLVSLYVQIMTLTCKRMRLPATRMLPGKLNLYRADSQPARTIQCSIDSVVCTVPRSSFFTVHSSNSTSYPTSLFDMDAPAAQHLDTSFQHK